MNILRSILYTLLQLHILNFLGIIRFKDLDLVIYFNDLDGLKDVPLTNLTSVDETSD